MSGSQAGFFPATARVPAGLETAVFTLTPLQPHHVKLDYEALLCSQAQLRAWSGSAWPQADFSLQDNLKDMEWHWEEHQKKIAFTFTVLNPAQNTCMGCIYIKSLAELVEKHTTNQEMLTGIGDLEATVRFWVATPFLAQDLDQQLLAAQAGWFESEWPFKRVSYHARAEDKRQLTLFQRAGLSQKYRLTMPQRGGVYEFWG